MRGLIVLAGIVPLLAGCGKADEGADGNAAAINYRPPTVTSRLDFGGSIERRFHRIDKDGDDRLTRDELPPRIRPAFDRYDADGNGSLNSDEWGKLMLDRFDRLDVNKDGTVTSEERDQVRAAARAGRTAP
jgi:Ca2+-binding EF-hand superfamily protein